MRGKGGDKLVPDGGDRITPARAGKRIRPIFSIGDRKDHPRACGEKTGTTDLYTKLEGSPPRVRGKVH